MGAFHVEPMGHGQHTSGSHAGHKQDLGTGHALRKHTYERKGNILIYRKFPGDRGNVPRETYRLAGYVNCAL